jgi:hypothetical protein
MEILLLYLFIISLNCLLTIFLYRELKSPDDDNDKLKIKYISWSIIIINFITLIITLFAIYSKKIEVNYNI